MSAESLDKIQKVELPVLKILQTGKSFGSYILISIELMKKAGLHCVTYDSILAESTICLPSGYFYKSEIENK